MQTRTRVGAAQHPTSNAQCASENAGSARGIREGPQVTQRRKGRKETSRRAFVWKFCAPLRLCVSPTSAFEFSRRIFRGAGVCPCPRKKSGLRASYRGSPSQSGVVPPHSRSAPRLLCASLRFALLNPGGLVSRQVLRVRRRRRRGLWRASGARTRGRSRLRGGRR
jgi:hypothetical protein